ncbi:MAG: glycosyltransferase family 39 protein [Candidatus Aminicenantes bacterium]|nr:glycosyltransferase family 39 protein [Candidatus Aminicenantes bacterium]
MDEGTFPSHLYAIVFKIFGYSILGPLVVIFFFFSAFVITQYFFYREIFSSESISLALCLFYSLPIGYLLALSFHLTYSPVVLFLGTLSLFLSYLLYKKNRKEYIPIIGLCLGLSFWTHPLTIYFASCCMIFLVMRLRFSIKEYFKLGIYGLVGCFPMILHILSSKGVSIQYLLPESLLLNNPTEKMASILNNIFSLLTWEKNKFVYILAGLLILGVATLIFNSVKRKKFLPENIFLILAIVIICIYMLSKFESNDLLIRYLYPLYVSLPVFLVYGMIQIRKKIKNFLIAGLFLLIFFTSNISGLFKSHLLVKEADANLKQLITIMEKTGKKYWTGGFWQSFLITALSGEKLICWSQPYVKYIPYRLEYLNRGENNNFLFFKEPGSYALKYKESVNNIKENLIQYFDRSEFFLQLLDRLHVHRKKIDIGNFGLLVFDLRGHIFPLELLHRIPDTIPDLVIHQIETSNRKLYITFRNRKLSNNPGFLIHIKIQKNISLERGFSSQKELIHFQLPLPNTQLFTIKYYLDYQGIEMPHTEKEISYQMPRERLSNQRPKIEFLSGFGPIVKVENKTHRICMREVYIRINKSVSKRMHVQLRLYSQFRFTDPRWHGDYIQKVKIACNGTHVYQKSLKYGTNVIDFICMGDFVKKRENILTLRFSYHNLFDYSPWMTSALLESVTISE